MLKEVISKDCLETKEAVKNNQDSSSLVMGALTIFGMGLISLLFTEDNTEVEKQEHTSTVESIPDAKELSEGEFGGVSYSLFNTIHETTAYYIQYLGDRFTLILHSNKSWAVTNNHGIIFHQHSFADNITHILGQQERYKKIRELISHRLRKEWWNGTHDSARPKIAESISHKLISVSKDTAVYDLTFKDEALTLTIFDNGRWQANNRDGTKVYHASFLKDEVYRTPPSWPRYSEIRHLIINTLLAKTAEKRAALAAFDVEFAKRPVPAISYYEAHKNGHLICAVVLENGTALNIRLDRGYYYIQSNIDSKYYQDNNNSIVKELINAIKEDYLRSFWENDILS